MGRKSKDIFDPKYQAFVSNAKKDLRQRYPGKEVDVVPSSEYRDPGTQHDIVKKGSSTTDVSLHGLGAAKDFKLVVDGQALPPSKNLKLYQDVLWKNAEQQGLFHLDPKGFGAVDPGHIGVIEEDGVSTFGRLIDKYPEVKQTDEYSSLYGFLNKKVAQGSPSPKEDSVFKQFNGQRYDPQLWFKPMYTDQPPVATQSLPKDRIAKIRAIPPRKLDVSVEPTDAPTQRAWLDDTPQPIASQSQPVTPEKLPGEQEIEDYKQSIYAQRPKMGKGGTNWLDQYK